MGQGQSSGLCRDISDREVVMFTKQFFTINKAIEILIDIEEGKRQELQPPQNYMLDIASLVPDLYYGEASELTLSIYKPTPSVAELKEGQIIQTTSTALDEYNNFVLKEITLLKETGGVGKRASEVREDLTKISEELLKYISNFCSDIGIQNPGFV